MSDGPDTDVEQADEPAPLALDTRSLPMRATVLKLMSKSPLHARHALLRGSDQTLSQRLGTAEHALLLGGAEVRIADGLSGKSDDAAKSIRAGEPIAVYEGAARRGKAWDSFAAENAGKTIYTRKEYDQAKNAIDLEASGCVLVTASQHRHALAMAESVKSNARARAILEAPKAVFESRIDWTWAGRSWRSTPDARGFRWLADLKTTKSADPAEFWRDAKRYGYDVQMALYRHAIEVTEGVRPQTVYIIAVESSPPYATVVYEFSERRLDSGWRKAQEWHARWLDCERRGVWPGYADGAVELDWHEEEDGELEVERAMADDDGARAEVSW